MSVNSRIYISLEKAADDYARSRQDRSRPVSLSSAIQEIRVMLPADNYTDKELAVGLAEKLIEHGHAIDFDTKTAHGRGECAVSE